MPDIILVASIITQQVVLKKIESKKLKIAHRTVIQVFCLFLTNVLEWQAKKTKFAGKFPFTFYYLLILDFINPHKLKLFYKNLSKFSNGDCRDSFLKQKHKIKQL